MRWELADKDLVLTIEDNGPGLGNPANVFVPFYTTKPSGSGIGLVLSRQIAEAHGGSIELLNRTDQKRLPGQGRASTHPAVGLTMVCGLLPSRPGRITESSECDSLREVVCFQRAKGRELTSAGF